VKRAFVLVILLAAAPRAAAQEPPGDALVPQITQARPSLPLSADAYVPITGLERVHWIVDGIVGPRSLGVGVLGGIWQTGFNTPQEWGRTPSGFGKRYLEREADVAISNTIEAGLGALWGEEPRYIPSDRRGLRPRVQYALKTAFLAQRRDGRLTPAWGRYAGNVFNNLIENSWLPPSATTPGETAIRSVEGMVTRMLGNLWEEFWPEVRKRIGK
jgi:hypothetical protein